MNKQSPCVHRGFVYVGYPTLGVYFFIPVYVKESLASTFLGMKIAIKKL